MTRLARVLTGTGVACRRRRHQTGQRQWVLSAAVPPTFTGEWQDGRVAGGPNSPQNRTEQNIPLDAASTEQPTPSPRQLTSTPTEADNRTAVPAVVDPAATARIFRHDPPAPPTRA